MSYGSEYIKEMRERRMRELRDAEEARRKLEEEKRRLASEEKERLERRRREAERMKEKLPEFEAEEKKIEMEISKLEGEYKEKMTPLLLARQSIREIIMDIKGVSRPMAAAVVKEVADEILKLVRYAPKIREEEMIRRFPAQQIEKVYDARGTELYLILMDLVKARGPLTVSEIEEYLRGMPEMPGIDKTGPRTGKLSGMGRVALNNLRFDGQVKLEAGKYYWISDEVKPIVPPE